MIFSLWDGEHRIFTLAFCLSTQGGKRIAYIGAIQGRNETDTYSRPNRVFNLDILDRYRDFTKKASGMRPRDFLVEAFKMLCKILHVDEIYAVADANHPLRQSSDSVKLSYDEIWRERGGHDNGRGFFVLPVTATRRADDDIPAKKRAMYRKRYALMDTVERELAAVLKPAAINEKN
jgi:uncharacterized protein VirK/YbjX